MSSAAKRHGFSISVKMILTSTALIVMIVALFALARRVEDEGP